MWQDPSGLAYDGEFAFKTSRNTMKYVEEGGASFADVAMGAFFVYQPPIIWPKPSMDALTTQRQLDVALWMPAIPRGFSGTLSSLATPLGLATIRSDTSKGLSITLGAHL